jgi:hypothetical protein
MNDHTYDLLAVDVDELWILEWAALGLVELERYLAKHAAFAEYLRANDDLESERDGDCSSAV